MNQKIQHIVNLIQQSKQLSEEEVSTIIQSLKDADKEISIAAFKIERLEKVKYTTTVLLEQTIEELEAKRKSVEQQKRELEIEAALERVRARTMAMQHSDELADTAHLLFQQFKQLGEDPIQITIGIFNEQQHVIEFRITGGDGSGSKIDQTFNADIDEPTLINKLFRAWKENRKSAILSLEGKELVQWIAYRNKLSGKYAYETKVEQGDRRYIAAGFFSKGALSISKRETFSEETIQILERFAMVFDLTYTRFLDLKNAEAQAREARIEAALERVRSRTMAMQKSDELHETSLVLFQQLKELGEPAEQLTIGIMHPAENFMEISATVDGKKFEKAFRHSGDEPFVMKKIVAAWKAQQKSLIIEQSTEELEAYNRFRNELTGSTKFPTRLQPGEKRFVYVALFSKGMLALSTSQPRPGESLELLERFASVFDLTYTRFSDLKQAEEQAKEAQIEAALERVRSRTMGMQASHQLKEIIKVVYEQFVLLNVLVEHAGFIVDYKERDDMNIWLADRHEVPFQIAIPYFDCAHWNSFVEAKQKGTDFFVNHLGFDEKNRFYEDLFELIPGVSEEAKNYYLSCPGLAISTVLLENVGLYIENFSGIPYTDEENTILRRFGKAFQQSYTRFLDLQKAEAQAKEAQIEAALERVRSRTMAMQKSDELPQAANLLFKQIQLLGMPAFAAGYCIWEDDRQAITLWMSSEGILQPPFKAPTTEDELFIQMRKGYEEGNSLHVVEMGGEQLVAHYQYMRTLPVVGEIFDSILKAGHSLPVFQVMHHAYFSKGFLLFITYERVPEAHDIFKRFASVFEQTYTRFLDLEKAEAQARESQIEAALEKVRSRTLAMQKSEELAETSAVLFQQLIKLGIEPNRLYICIIKDREANAEFWITDEDGSKVSMAYSANLHDHFTFKEMFEGWKHEKESLIIDMQGEELETYFAYLNSIGVPFKGGLLQKRRLQYISYFSKGFIGIASPDEQTNETIELLNRFAYVFNLTFTRFNDLQIAEAHALRAEQDLIEIKAARKRAEDALAELKATQAQLVHAEKMASLGELTAGIAHEIQNPLNFVNNFSEVNMELIDEMQEEIKKGNPTDALEISGDIRQNLQKISHHGNRADAIVKSMLQHSRKNTGQKEATDINALVDEFLRLSYHGLRAKDKSFNAIMETHFDASIEKVQVSPQDVGRVLLNLFNNAFYAVNEKKKSLNGTFEPVVQVTTTKAGNSIEIRVKDNGTGIPEKVLDKIYQPFFTTKPTGEGTGLGLSLSYDIITKGHGGEMKVKTKEGEGSEFVIQLPIS